MEKLQSKILLDSVLLSFISLFLLIFATVACFVFRKIGFTNAIIWLVILSIGIVMAILAIFYSINIRINVSERNSIRATGDISHSWAVNLAVVQFVRVAPVAFLQIAIVLNINMWVHFLLKIEVMAASLKLKVSSEDDGRKIKRQRKIANISSTLLVLGILGYLVGVIVDWKSYYPHDHMTVEEIAHYQRSIYLVIGLFFATVSFLFFLVSLMTIQRIQRYFPGLYLAHKRKMYLAMFGLSVPLILHAILDLLNINTSYILFKYNHLEVFNAITIFFGFLIPVGFQFSSLVFGFIRNKNDRNRFRVAGEQYSNVGEARSDSRMDSEVEKRSSEPPMGETGQNVGRVSEVSLNSAGLNMDYFDPPLLDYLPPQDHLADKMGLHGHGLTTEAQAAPLLLSLSPRAEVRPDGAVVNASVANSLVTSGNDNSKSFKAPVQPPETFSLADR